MGLVLEAWHELEGERYPGPYCAGPIPPTSIYIWGDRIGLDTELTMIVSRAIRYCDGQRAERIASELANKG